MKICKCPYCAELVHFDSRPRVQQCWNCDAVTDFSVLKSLGERFAEWLSSNLSTVWVRLEHLAPDYSRFSGTARLALMIAAPVAVLMLLLGNSLDITIVQEPTMPFTRP